MQHSIPPITTLEMIFGQVNGSSIITLDTVTIPTLKGGMKNPHKGRVLKHGVGHSVMVFQNKHTNGYDAMVRRRLEAEGKNPDTFELSPRKWGVRLQGLPFVEHNGALYLEVIFLKPGSSYYSLDGVKCDPSLIQGLELDHQEAEQGGLENKVILRTFKCDSIRRVSVGGANYTFGY